MNIKSKATVNVDFKITIDLTIGQANALNAIVGYGPDKFVEWFYKTHGRAYLQPHEKDMRELFDICRHQLSTAIHRVDEAKKSINVALKDM